MEGTKRSGGPRGGHVPLFFTRLHRCFASLSIDSGNGGKRGRKRRMGSREFHWGGRGDDSVSFDDLHSPVENRRWFHRMHYAWPKFCLLVSLLWAVRVLAPRNILLPRLCSILGDCGTNVVETLYTCFLFDVFLWRWFSRIVGIVCKIDDGLLLGDFRGREF